jgi:RNA polymerase sigma factor (TIGR02999 family)
MTEAKGDVTRLLADLRSGKKGAGDRLFPLIYDELHQLAKRYMRRERPDHTLQPTALVHEAYLRLSGGQEIDWESRSHFYQFAAQAMRSILIDYARRKGAAKKGKGWKRTPLEDELILVGDFPAHLLQLNGSLDRLSGVDERMARIVELRYFGGLNVEETAKVLSISPRTVKSDWRIAKAWLKRDIEDTGG